MKDIKFSSCTAIKYYIVGTKADVLTSSQKPLSQCFMKKIFAYLGFGKDVFVEIPILNYLKAKIVMM